MTLSDKLKTAPTPIFAPVCTDPPSSGSLWWVVGVVILVVVGAAVVWLSRRLMRIETAIGVMLDTTPPPEFVDQDETEPQVSEAPAPAPVETPVLVPVEPPRPRVEEISVMSTPDSPVMVHAPSNELLPTIMTTKTATLTKPPLPSRKRSKPSNSPDGGPAPQPPLSLDDAIAKLDGAGAGTGAVAGTGTEVA